TVVDSEGMEYVDVCASFGSLALGHNHPEVKEAMVSYLQSDGLMQGMGDVYASVAKGELTADLVDFLPEKLCKVAYGLSGSDAVELACKTAMLASKKPGILAFKESYHGLHLGCMVITGLERFCKPFPRQWQQHPGVYHISFRSSVAEVVEVIRASQSSLAPIGQMIIEPIIGRFGVYPLAENYLIELYEALKDLGCVLIYDEVYTGFGRAGYATFAHHFPADVICLGKALGGGMAISCVAARAKIMDCWPVNRGEALHTGTFFGHPLSCTVARTTLQILLREQLIERSAQLGKEVLDWLQSHIIAPSLAHGCRGKGLFIAVDTGRKFGGVALAAYLKTAGVIAVPSGCYGEHLAITPALNIPRSLLWQALQKMREGLLDFSK
ncbi:MAG: aspartate aminotransferase family protein, partial [Proteobacteria bacterium]|nr:aspartate aminotransferase family protein [Pseudomonadota bacterium]